MREDIEFSYINDRGDIFKRTHPFEGIIPNLERRFRETQSQSVRDELSKFISTQPCPTCEGSRLNIQSRHVFIKNKNLPQLTELSIADAYNYFSKLKLTGSRGKIAEKIIKEIKERLEFLIDVGLNYLS